MADLLKTKEKVKERYARLALTGDSCCGPSATFESEGGAAQEIIVQFYNPSQSAAQVSELVGYDSKELKSIPEASILGARYGTPTKFAFIKEVIGR
jgi:arsenite methyltransferase